MNSAGIRIRYLGLMRVRNPLFRDKDDMLVRAIDWGLIECPITEGRWVDPISISTRDLGST